jgi:hypothetical protein
MVERAVILGHGACVKNENSKIDTLRAFVGETCAISAQAMILSVENNFDFFSFNSNRLISELMKSCGTGTPSNSHVYNALQLCSI